MHLCLFVAKTALTCTCSGLRLCATQNFTRSADRFLPRDQHPYWPRSLYQTLVGVQNHRQPFPRRPLCLPTLVDQKLPRWSCSRWSCQYLFLPWQPRGKTQQESADKNKKEKPAKDEKNNLSKQERKWLEVFRFSKQRYETNAEFRLEVEEAYRRMQREHSEYAFSINAEDAKGELVKKDRYKVGGDTTLYNNPLAQDYVNRVGQSMVPVGSDKLFAFRIMLNPVPEARSLSTGTIYVSTGLLASIDNEAQLSYVLGHEIAHVEKEHWKDDVLVAEGLEEWNEKNRQRERNLVCSPRLVWGLRQGAWWTPRTSRDSA